MASSKITDAGLESLLELKHLRFLHLIDAPITDLGLERLQGLKSLESLYLDHVQVTDDGARQFSAAMPKVHFHHDGDHPPGDSHADDHHHDEEPAGAAEQKHTGALNPRE